MITITSGSIENVKGEMKRADETCRGNIKAIREFHKKNKIKKLPRVEQAKIDEFEKQRKFYIPSKIIPVNLFGIVINFKLYEAFMKKIKDFDTQTLLYADHVKIEYRKGKESGTLILENMVEYFKDFEHLPVAVINDGR